MKSSREVYDRLYEIAADQNGYFTTKQAIAAGLPHVVGKMSTFF